MTRARSGRVLIGCEQSGVVRRAFAARGWDAWSCDIEPSEDRSNQHLIGDIRDHLDGDWDLMFVAHPPCTRLCNSGVRWLHTPPPGRSADEMWQELDEAAALFSACWYAPIPHIAVENPVMHKHAKKRIVNYQPFAQSVRPWQFGHGETKRTCFWLRDLPLLEPTQIVDGRQARIHRMPPGPERARERSRTFAGIAEAIADQWGGYVLDGAAKNLQPERTKPMNTTDAKALLLRFNPIYPFDLFLGMKLPRLYIETIQSLLGKGYTYPSTTRPPEMTADDRLAVSHVVEQYAFESPDYEPIDISPSRMQTYEAGLIAALLRNPPADQPSTGGGTYTKADLDAAEERGYARCRADGLKAIGGLHS